MGTEFTIELELDRCTEKEETKTEASKPAFDLQGIHILLAEDNTLNAQIATELLEMRGAVTDTAVNGQEAVDKFTKSPEGYYKLILMDIQMPVKNGLEAAAQIRAGSHPDAERVPIVAMTANSFQEDVEAARKAGMNGFVPKPVDVGYLYEVLEGILRDASLKG